jgi:8-oxo-dGTP pyrophosphatase MutT (NUDIX family)
MPHGHCTTFDNPPEVNGCISRSSEKSIGSRPIIVAGATVVVMNEEGEILFQRRSDSFDWGLPGGAMEPGETLEETARRELKEETGLDAAALQLLGVFSGPRYYYRYPNGDEVYNVIALYRARQVSGTLQISDNEASTSDFSKDRLPRLDKQAAALLEECGEQMWLKKDP